MKCATCGGGEFGGHVFDCSVFQAQLPKPTTPAKGCAHEEFDAFVAVGRLTAGEAGSVTSHLANVRILCRACRTPMQFIGLDIGLQLRGAAMSVDGLEARLGLVPMGEVAAPLEGFTGYTVSTPKPTAH